MADQEDIDAVKELLGADAEAHGWTDERIEALLDEGLRIETIARRYWEFRSSRTANLADVSESGSSRKLSQIAENAIGLARYWRGADAASDPANQPGSVCRPIDRV